MLPPGRSVFPSVVATRAACQPRCPRTAVLAGRREYQARHGAVQMLLLEDDYSDAGKLLFQVRRVHTYRQPDEAVRRVLRTLGGGEAASRGIGRLRSGANAQPRRGLA